MREVSIFTIESELPFAGHPTIGTTYLLLQHLGWDFVDTITPPCGPIRVTKSSSSSDGRVTASIPHDVHLHARTLADVVRPDDPRLSSDPAIREAVLGAPIFSIVNGMTFVLARLPSLDVLGRVAKTQLDLSQLRDTLLDEGWRAGFMGCYYYVDVGDGGGEEQGRRLRTRMVELSLEDPATGSAASALSAYLTLKEEKRGRKFEITQGVEMGRKSVISVETTVKSGENKIDSVWLGGTAVVVMNGSLRVDATS